MPHNTFDDKSTLVQVQCHQAASQITRISVDPDRHMASPGHNEIEILLINVGPYIQ